MLVSSRTWATSGSAAIVCPPITEFLWYSKVRPEIKRNLVCPVPFREVEYWSLVLL